MSGALCDQFPGVKADFLMALLCVGLCLSWSWCMESPLMARQLCRIFISPCPHRTCTSGATR